ncbi:MAG: Maf family nucleotide pyrophosphatase [Hyphomicrobiaceae bacterium]|nr:Maf family nucleotide pyrophosphatase [Hyphomicrobiaceae bacterium]
MSQRLVLASASRSRRQMLEAAGLSFEVVPSRVDEPALRRTLEADGKRPEPGALALALAEAKALDVSRTHPDAIVIGGDQVLAVGTRILEKPPSLEAARQQLLDLRGRRHILVSAVALARGGEVGWAHAETAEMTVRPFGPGFLERYLDSVGDAVCQSVGAYQLEGLGAQLFERIDGDYFTILGLPLIALLGELRAREVIET